VLNGMAKLTELVATRIANVSEGVV
jgi:hypothetical protein